MSQENITAAQEAVAMKPPDLDLSEVESNNSSDEESYDSSSVSDSSNDGKEEEMSQENITADQEAVVKKPPDLALSEEFVKKLYDEVRLSASEVASYVNDGNKDEDLLTLYFSASKQGVIPYRIKPCRVLLDTV